MKRNVFAQPVLVPFQGTSLEFLMGGMPHARVGMSMATQVWPCHPWLARPGRLTHRSRMPFLEAALAILLVLAGGRAAGGAEPAPSAEATSNGMLPLSPAELNKASSKPSPPEKVTFEGVTYQADDAIGVLLGVALNEAMALPRREAALDVLGHLGTTLQGRDCIRKLIEMYDGVDARDLRGGILLCLVKSEDERGLGLFKKVIETEDDPWLLLFAAGGLAEWNERSGVRKLIDLLRSKEGSATGTVAGEQAANLLYSGNLRKLWGFPTKEVFSSLQELEDRQARMALLHREWESWFRENERRFPVWSAKTPTDKSGEKAQKMKKQ